MGYDCSSYSQLIYYHLAINRRHRINIRPGITGSAPLLVTVIPPKDGIVVLKQAEGGQDIKLPAAELLSVTIDYPRC